MDPERKRILLTAKKTLVESKLPILVRIEDAEAGMVVHGTIWKVSEKSLVVEFYNHVRAVVPFQEVRYVHPIGKDFNLFNHSTLAVKHPSQTLLSPTISGSQ